MMRPEAFQQPYITVENLPYSSAGDNSPSELFSVGGVLQRGHIVWTREAYNLHTCPHSTLAFVDEVGVVSLDPRWLTRADAIPDQTTSRLEH